MHIQSETTPQAPLVAEKSEVTLPSGLIGLPDLKDFLLITDPEIYPFVILRHRGTAEVDFLAVDPSTVLEEYQLDVSDADAAELGLTPSGKPPVILNIAIIESKEPPRIKANLIAPVLFNRETGLGKQVLLENSADYSAEHLLDIPGL